MGELTCLEICAGAGGASLGIEQAGFTHAAAVELDPDACETLRLNRGSDWKIIEDDIHNVDGRAFAGIDLLSGGVPCPPFSIAGKQLGQEDDRDLFPEALRLIAEIGPRAVLLENVRGLATRRFDTYRAQVLEQLHGLGYQTWWDLVHASEHGVPQLRPRFVLVAIKEPWAAHFHWPAPSAVPPPTVGQVLHDLMAERGWPGADAWSERAPGHRADHRRRQQEARRTRPGSHPGAGGVETARGQRARRRLRPARTRFPARPDAQADHPDGGPHPGFPGQLAVLRPQDRGLPSGRQRLPAAGGPGPGGGDPAGAGTASPAPHATDLGHHASLAAG